MEPKVTKKDLIEDLENFPIEVVEKMLQKQYKQVNKMDITVFQKNNLSDIQHGGFRWEDTIEGHNFWNDVIHYKKFDRFFGRYPKLSNNVYIYGDDKLYENVIKTLERRGGINTKGLLGNSDYAVYYIDPKTNQIERCTQDDEKLYNVITSTFEKIEPDKFIIEMTLPEIAEKLGIDIELLRIKK
jgi:hypothetical protein